MIIVYTTLPSETVAKEIGRELVEKRLAGCVNIFPGMFSIYRWEGEIETADETVMLVKTRQDLENEVFEAISAKHPYTTPALFAFAPHHVAAPYFEWLCNQTGPER